MGNTTSSTRRNDNETLQRKSEAESAAAAAAASAAAIAVPEKNIAVKNLNVGERSSFSSSGSGTSGRIGRQWKSFVGSQAKDQNSSSSISAVTAATTTKAKISTGRAESVEGIETSTSSDVVPRESAAIGVSAQRLKQRQASAWSFGSLSGRFNWSFTGSGRFGGGGGGAGGRGRAASKSISSSSNSNFTSIFRTSQRNKTTRKSLSAVQQRRSKTQWHKPLTNAIFSSHFKESSRNDQFYIEHLIAKGAFGIVFLVTDKKQRCIRTPQQHKNDICKNSVEINSHNQQQKQQQQQQQSPIGTTAAYALKVLKKSKVIEQNSVKQIKDEADIQKLCGHHPFIIQQLDLWQNRHNLHILSEYVPNGELFSKIALFSINLIRVYLAEIALAIDFLHNAGIIYRDAKPENILLTENYHIKLIDFGLSKWLKLGATTNTMCGTFQYMAPEILRGEPYGHAVDWWSLGIIVCQMFTQKSPNIKQYLNVALPSEVTTSSAASLKNHNIHSDDVLQQDSIMPNVSSEELLPQAVADLPHEAKDVLQRLLEIDPKKRIHSVMSLQRIALYKNFQIDAKHLLSISPLDIIIADNIPLCNDDNYEQYGRALATKAFENF